jgi:hypothetical protein
MFTRVLLVLAGALILLRVPSLTQPMGGDQGLYAYVGDRILAGDLAYRDAWDQKPPGVHYVYAALRRISHRDVVVPAADLAAAVLTAGFVWLLAWRLGGPAAGALAAVFFLLLSDPSMDRYGGVRVRAQAETFIALAVAAAVGIAVVGTRARRLRMFAAGLLVGVVFTLKYNAGLYGIVVLAGVALMSGLTIVDVLAVVAGALIVPLAMLAVFWGGGALNDLYRATVVYNLQYSGETYARKVDMLRYLAVFPIRHARANPLWFVGGLGCVALLVAGIRRRQLWIPILWTAAACLSIAINGSRELPQYFVQAAPALAVAAGLGAAVALGRAPRAARWVAALLVAYGCWRVGAEPFPKKLAASVWSDTQYLAGRVDRRTHLARFGGARRVDKYSALDNIDIGWFLSQRMTSLDTVYVFGFSPGSYAYAERRSASRFFWSRPVILDFNGEDPRYGIAGLRNDLEHNSPKYVILQEHDWAPDVQDSAAFFLSQPALADWLRVRYHEVRPFVEGFSAWERNSR